MGTTGTGQPVYGAAVSVPGRFVGKRRAVRRSDGTDVIADATFDVRPGLDVPAESRVTRDGKVYEVLAVSDAEDLTRSHHKALILEGPKP